MKIDLTVERVRELFDYDPETGIVTRRVWQGGKSRVGDAVGCDRGDGRLLVRADGQLYRLHRIIWLHVHGAWPENIIDHINGDPSDNRLCNLRAATHAENMRNSKPRKGTRSGLKGVMWCGHTGKWRSRVAKDGKITELGRFDTPEEAHAAYSEAAKRLFGEFARVA